MSENKKTVQVEVFVIMTGNTHMKQLQLSWCSFQKTSIQHAWTMNDIFLSFLKQASTKLLSNLFLFNSALVHKTDIGTAQC